MTTASAGPRAREVPVDTVVAGRVLRFDRTERILHAANAVLVLVLALTGLILYVGPLSALVGRRVLVETIHVVAGLALPVPLVAALAGRWRAGLRRDAARISRWSDEDTRWLRSRGRDAKVRVGKFNAGQKANALFVAGALPVAFATGLILNWFQPFSDSMRTGATLVHDTIAVALWFAIAGHIAKALSEPVTLRAIWSGWTPLAWARRHRPRWADEVDPPPPEAHDRV